jgi:hypothetical protein
VHSAQRGTFEGAWEGEWDTIICTENNVFQQSVDGALIFRGTFSYTGNTITFHFTETRQTHMGFVFESIDEIIPKTYIISGSTLWLVDQDGEVEEFIRSRR